MRRSYFKLRTGYGSVTHTKRQTGRSVNPAIKQNTGLACQMAEMPSGRIVPADSPSGVVRRDKYGRKIIVPASEFALRVF